MRSKGYSSWVRVSVCPISHISPLGCLFVLKSISRTQRATKVKTFSLKLLRSGDPALPLSTAILQAAIFSVEARMRMR